MKNEEGTITSSKKYHEQNKGKKQLEKQVSNTNRK